MSLLLDENLSPRLTLRLTSLFPGITHVRDVGLKQVSDEDIWKWAPENAYSVLTADSDFVNLANNKGPPPKVIHLERCDFPFRLIEEILRQNAIRISEFERDMGNGLLVLRKAIQKYGIETEQEVP